MAGADHGTLTAADQTEIEWQFDALDLRPVERWVTALPAHVGSGLTALITVTALAKPVRRLSDRYLDTEDWRIGRAGYVLRTRRRGQGSEVTLKDSRPAEASGLRRRLEVTEVLGPDGVDALGSTGPVGRRVHAVAGHHALRQVIEVRTRRRAFALRISGEEAAELAMDETVISARPGQRPVHLNRVEVEVASPWVDVLAPLVANLRDSCGLRPATLSKFEAGLLALGMEVPGAPDLGDTDVNRDSTVGELALAVIRRHLGVMLSREPGTRLGEDIEDLHQMRVATRRLRAALDFFAEVLPQRSRSMSSELAWMADVLGHVRDLDVQIEHIEGLGTWSERWHTVVRSDRSPVDELLSVLAGDREQARLALLESLDSARWERLVSGLTSMVIQRRLRLPAGARQRATSVLPDLVESRHRAVVKAARRARRTGDPRDFHRLRIRGKRLRYSLEFTSGVYGGRTDRFTRRLALLQDTLGLMQDADVATTRLWSLATGSDPEGRPREMSPASVFFVGAMAEHYRARSDELLRGMPKRLKLLEGSEWKELRTHMDRHRGTQEGPAPQPETEVRPKPPPGSGTEPVSPDQSTTEVPPFPAPAVAPLSGPTLPDVETALASWPVPVWGPSDIGQEGDDSAAVFDSSPDGVPGGDPFGIPGGR